MPSCLSNNLDSVVVRKAIVAVRMILVVCVCTKIKQTRVLLLHSCGLDEDDLSFRIVGQS